MAYAVEHGYSDCLCGGNCKEIRQFLAIFPKVIMQHQCCILTEKSGSEATRRNTISSPCIEQQIIRIVNVCAKLERLIDACKGDTGVKRFDPICSFQGWVSCRDNFHRIQKNEKSVQYSSLGSHLGWPIPCYSLGLSIGCPLGRLCLYKYTHNNNNNNNNQANIDQQFIQLQYSCTHFKWILLLIASSHQTYQDCKLDQQSMKSALLASPPPQPWSSLPCKLPWLPSLQPCICSQPVEKLSFPNQPYQNE